MKCSGLTQQDIQQQKVFLCLKSIPLYKPAVYICFCCCAWCEGPDLYCS